MLAFEGYCDKQDCILYYICRKYYECGVPISTIKCRCHQGKLDELKLSDKLDGELRSKLYECFLMEQTIRLLREQGL